MLNKSQSAKKTFTTFTDSSVFILKLGRGATGPCCNTPYIRKNSFLCQNATFFLEKVLRRFVWEFKSSFGRFFDLVQIMFIKEAGEELKE